MDDPSARLAREFRYPSIRTLYPGALWMRAAAAGLLIAAGAMAALAERDVSRGVVLAALAVCAAPVVLSWRRFGSAVVPNDGPKGSGVTTSAQADCADGGSTRPRSFGDDPVAQT